MAKSRKIPEGWRVVTPTEKLTLEHKFASKVRCNPDILTWSSIESFELGKSLKELRAKDELKSMPMWIYIAPKKQKTS